MHLTAFIPTSHADYGIAVMCANRCRALGWEPILLTTERQWTCGPPPGAIACDYDREGWGMYGNWCAFEILRKIDAHAPAGEGVVMKLDADVALLAAGAEWLADCAATGRAHCLRLEGYHAHRRAWGGLWAAPRASVPAMADFAKMARACRCPESVLCLTAANDSCGLTVSPTLTAQIWGTGDHERHAGALTLPIQSRRATRASDAVAMFDFRG